jgi:hypothetical protein
MRFTILLLVLASAIVFGADNAAVAANAAAGLSQQTSVFGRRSSIVGTEAITIPPMLSYQGRLTDTLGMPVADTLYAIRFMLYVQPTGGSPFWQEDQSVRTEDGLFNVLLGSVTPVDSVVGAGTVYLAMTVSGGPQLTPRIRIASSAFAYLCGRAANADLLQGKDTTGFVRTGQTNSVTSNMIVDGAIAAADFSSMGAAAGQVMKYNGSAWVPRNDSVGQDSGGTVTSVSQATGVICTPNPINSTGTVGFDQTYGDGRYERVANKNAAGGYCGLDGSTKVPNARLYTGSGNGLDVDQLDGSHSTAFAPATGSASYIQNQSASYQAANWKIVGQGQDSSATGTALRGVSTYANGIGILGRSISGTGVVGVCSSTVYSAIEGSNDATSGTGVGVGGFGNAAVGVYGYSSHSFGVYGRGVETSGVYGYSSNSYGVQGTSSADPGVCGASTSSDGILGTSTSLYGVHGKSRSSYGGLFESDSFGGVCGASYLGGTGHGVGVYGTTPTYRGVEGFRTSTQKGSDYSESGTRGGLWGYTYWGDTFAFGASGYTYGDDRRTGGVIGAEASAGTWGSLGYKNSSGSWYAGYGTSGWTSGSGLSSHQATGIGCGYGGGLMGGWLKGDQYGATVSGRRYALYTQGNNYTSGYSAVMQSTGDRRVASYVPTSATVDVYASGVAEMKGGTASVAFPASFASIVSKDVPVVVTATPMGPAPIYLSSSDNTGFAVAAVDAKMAGSVKFAWIAVGRRAGYEKNPEVPAELCRTDFDAKMDGVMFNENDLKHSAQPVWFDGTQLRFDNPPEEVRPPKPARPANAVLRLPTQVPTSVLPGKNVIPSRTMPAPIIQPSSTQSTGAEK